MKKSFNGGTPDRGSLQARKAFFGFLVSVRGMLAIAGMVFATASYAAPSYTGHPRHGGSPRVVPVWIDPNFTQSEHDQMLSAIEEWNAALNGVARIDVVAAPEGRGANQSWLIRRGPGKEGVRELGRRAQSLGSVQGMPMGGGVLLIFPGASAYLQQHSLSLRDVMMREIGHLMGLRHLEHAEPLAEDYAPGDRGCVNEATATAVAAILKVPATALNWCEPR
jgi:hypothetical protein